MQRKLSRASHVSQALPIAPQQIKAEPMEVDTTNQTIQNFQQNNNLMLLASINAAATAAAAATSAGISPPVVGQKRVSTTVMPITLKSVCFS